MLTLMQFDESSFIERVSVLRTQYQHITGRLPTHLIITNADLLGFTQWIDDAADDEALYAEELYVGEQQQPFGMAVRIERYAAQMRVYFQES